MDTLLFNVLAKAVKRFVSLYIKCLQRFRQFVFRITRLYNT